MDLEGGGMPNGFQFNPCLPQRKPVILWEDALACPEAVKPAVSLDVLSNWLCTSFLLILRNYAGQAAKRVAAKGATNGIFLLPHCCVFLGMSHCSEQGWLCKGQP